LEQLTKVHDPKVSLRIREIINAVYADLPKLPPKRALENLRFLLQFGCNSDVCDNEFALEMISRKQAKRHGGVVQREKITTYHLNNR
jgi:hypothetical protein